MTASRAHLKRTRTALIGASAARDRFSSIIVEASAAKGWCEVPLDYRATWHRLDAEYTAARDAYTAAREEVEA